MFVRPGGDVEQRRLPAVGIPDEGHAYDVVPFGRRARHLLLDELHVVAVRSVDGELAVLPEHDILGLILAHHLDVVGLFAAERNLVADDFIFYGVLQGSVQDDLDLVPEDEAHFRYPPLETAVAVYLDDDAAFPCP